ncbi:MAG: 50S ribosomal protein L6 [Dehalococcoidales bacterium]|jgi:large subunit ribosomal protein L6|nr:50S ribosomal protein L6 [Dehalococcoidales bacterium]MDD5604671.1 50S ribosomal protein L6 [Dehalococcoidales bacterium]MDX9986123.1 50S ribosomal protein L6 [Dehalococcoidales bacterium]NLE89902.1 50S ribosomal protein L6 [Dehalococcoidales bacterium]
MSRIGRMPITVPQGVSVEIKEHDIKVKGPKGELSRKINPAMEIKLEDGILRINRPSDAREHRAQHGLTRALIANMVEGVSKGFEKSLEIVGVGYRAEKVGEKLVLKLGFSHTCDFDPEPGIMFELENPNKIKVIGIDKEKVGKIAAEIKKSRLPDAYKGKGVRYAGEKIRIKPGKAGKAVGGKK